MLGAVARKELIETVRDGRFRVLAIIMSMLLLASLLVGWQEAAEARHSAHEAQRAEAAVWLDQGAKNPHSAAHFGRYAFKPTPALSFVDRGVDSYLGTAVWLEAHWQAPFQFRTAEDRSSAARTGELTAAWTLQVLLPLCVILLAFGAFAGERERGTLRQVLSLGADPRTLMLGKALGVAGALGATLVPAAVLGLVVLAVGLGGAATADATARAALLVLVYLAYLAIILCVALAVSARAGTPRGALAALLGFWLVSTFLIPRVTADVAERLHPVPTPRQFYAAIAEDEKKGIAAHGPPDEREQALERQVLARYGVARIEDLPVSFAGISLQASEEHSNLVFDEHFGELWRIYERQAAVHRWAALASPFMALRAISMAMAGTDVEQHRHFADAAEAHRRELVRYLNEDMTRNARGKDFGYLAEPELWARAPVFTYEPPTLAWVLARNLGLLALLVSWLVVTVAIMLWSARRQRPI